MVNLKKIPFLNGKEEWKNGNGTFHFDGARLCLIYMFRRGKEIKERKTVVNKNPPIYICHFRLNQIS